MKNTYLEELLFSYLPDPPNTQPTEGIEIELSPDVLREGESEGNAPQSDVHGSHEHDAEAKRKLHIDDQYDQSDNETRNLRK